MIAPLLCGVLLSFLPQTTTLTDDSQRVETTHGPVVGVADPEHAGVRRFLGIPFAKPPVGEARWKRPVAPDAWEAPLPATDFVLAAAQPEPRSYEGIGERGEDCLYLNVYSPPQEDEEAQRQLAPVLFWIHGGGFLSGTAMSSNYDGAVLASEGLCVVAPNYRLGPMGFMAHPALSAEFGASGNQAMFDLLLALEWVRDNAAAFGGDPDNVTIAGQSSGGAAVCALMTSPLATGLFHKAIVQSGEAAADLVQLSEASDEHPSAEDIGRAVALEVGIEGEDAEALAALRKVPADDLVAAWVKVQSKYRWLDLCVDGKFLTESPAASFASGRQAQVPTLVGANMDESSMFTLGSKLESVEQYHEWVVKRFGDNLEPFLELYPANDAETGRLRQIEVGNDLYAMSARHIARTMSVGEISCWRYRFARVSKLGQMLRMGSFHGAEVAYLFGRLENDEYYDETDRALATKLRAYWESFARTGDPNQKTLPDWPNYDGESEPFLILDGTIGTGAKWRPEQCDLLESLLHE